MPEALTIDFTRPVPLFPLPNCALLPHATVPLHVFEHRYRDMVREALDSRGLIAMAVFAGDKWKHNYKGNPPLREYVCVGYIVQHQQLDDGRYNILLQGVCRARIVREINDGKTDYRRAELEPTEAESPMEIDLEERRAHLERQLNDPRLKQLAAVSAVHNWLSRDIPTPAMIDLAILTLCQDVERRYAMLAEADADKRADWLEHHLAETEKLLETAERLGPAVTDDGTPLN